MENINKNDQATKGAYQKDVNDLIKSGLSNSNVSLRFDKFSRYVRNECQARPDVKPFNPDNFIELIRDFSNNNFFVLCAELKSNMAINLATNFENNGISIDRILGCPIIPGSAIKGVCSHASDKGELYNDVFGVNGADSESEGKVNFYDAYMVQGECDIDILAPHKNNKVIPINFPVVKKGSRFLFIASLNYYGKKIESQEKREKILQHAKNCMLSAFKNGIGAKVSSGYGWFEYDEAWTDALISKIKEKAAIKARKLEEEAAEKAREIERQRRRANMSEADIYKEDVLAFDDPTFADQVKDIENLPEYKQRVLCELFNNEKKDKLKNWKKKKPNIYEKIAAVAQKLQIQI